LYRSGVGGDQLYIQQYSYSELCQCERYWWCASSTCNTDTGEDILADADFTIMPNPSNGLIEIDLSNYNQRKVQLEMYNLQGKLLRSVNIESINGKEEVDLTSFSQWHVSDTS
jgi:hypothetical protein